MQILLHPPTTAPAPDGGSPDSGSAPAATPCTNPLGETPDVRLCGVTRVGTAPLISATTHPGIGKNISMPSVIRAPAALTANLGDYWMYFAAHDGHYIRLATADSPAGPWSVYAPGTLTDTEVAPFSNTISSPDVFVLPDGRVRMYFSCDSYPGSTEQWSGVSESTNGVDFTLASTENIAKYYLRVFEYNGATYGLQKGWSTAVAELGVSTDGIERFTLIKTLSGGSIRHMAVQRDGNTLLVFYSVIGDAPERLLLSTIDLASGPPSTWDLSAPIEVLRPETDYEGAQRPVVASVKGPATNVNQLRDPYVFVDNGTVYLYYGVAGESGIALATVNYQLR